MLLPNFLSLGAQLIDVEFKIEMAARALHRERQQYRETAVQVHDQRVVEGWNLPQ